MAVGGELFAHRPIGLGRVVAGGVDEVEEHPAALDMAEETVAETGTLVRADEREFVLADIPGLIEGAHEGAGLGDQFLGHVERCRALLHLVDGTSEHAGRAYKLVRRELEAYGHGLADKPEIVALSKADALDPDTLKEQTARLRRAAKRAPLALSSASGQGVREALRALMRVIEVERTAAEAPQAAEEWRP